MKESSHYSCSHCGYYPFCHPFLTNQRETMTRLTNRVQELEQENAALKNTVEWMHATIWDMVKKQRHSH